MHVEGKGLFWTLDPLSRVWGQRRREVLREPPKNGEVVVKSPAGFISRVISLQFELHTTGAEVEVEPYIELLNADEKHVLLNASGIKETTALTKSFLWLADFPIPALQGLKPARAPLPDILLYPGDELNFACSRPKGEYELFNPFLVWEQYEIEPEHDNYYAHKLIERLARLERIIQNGTASA